MTIDTPAPALDLKAMDESVSNTELLTDELHENPEVGSAEADEAREDGLEAVAPQGMAEMQDVGEDEVPSLDGLADVALASTGTVVPESVIGTDDRIRISPADRYPWSAHCSLSITAADGSDWVGTGFFVSPRLLVTAGHCVFIHAPGTSRHGWVRQIQAMPGRDGDSLPFGTHTSSTFYSVRGWTNSRNEEYDYGAIVLSSPVGSRTGTLGFGAYNDATIRASTGNLAGYPADRGGASEQYYMARRVNSVSARKVYYDIDTFGGQSGSAVYRIADGKRYAFGVHAYGVGSSPLNSATRITRPVFDNLLAWKNAHA